MRRLYFRPKFARLRLFSVRFFVTRIHADWPRASRIALAFLWNPSHKLSYQLYYRVSKIPRGWAQTGLSRVSGPLHRKTWHDVKRSLHFARRASPCAFVVKRQQRAGEGENHFVRATSSWTAVTAPCLMTTVDLFLSFVCAQCAVLETRATPRNRGPTLSSHREASWPTAGTGGPL